MSLSLRPDVGPDSWITTLERVIDTRPCDPLLPEDCEHHEEPIVTLPSSLYPDVAWDYTASHGQGFQSAADDPQRPCAEVPFDPVEHARRLAAARRHLELRKAPRGSVPATWWNHLKWTLARRWPRLFGRLSVRWRAS